MLPYIDQPKISLGPLTIHAFGVLVAMAVIVGARLSRWRAERQGLDGAGADRLVTWILAGGFIGAHLVDRFVYFPGETLEDPASILWIWKGLSSFGGFLGAVVGAAIFIRRHRLGHDPWRYLDAVAWAFPIGWVFGRTGCFLAFDHPGDETTFFLGQLDATNVVRHNLGLYEALYTIPIILLFWALRHGRRAPGFFVGWLAIVYAPVRFLFDFLRVRDVRYLGLTPGQWGAIALIGVGFWILRRSIAKEKGEAAAATSPSK